MIKLHDNTINDFYVGENKTSALTSRNHEYVLVLQNWEIRFPVIMRTCT
jgi:hypothetical protein